VAVTVAAVGVRGGCVLPVTGIAGGGVLAGVNREQLTLRRAIINGRRVIRFMIFLSCDTSYSTNGWFAIGRVPVGGGERPQRHRLRGFL